jgi:hypothetical protein
MPKQRYINTKLWNDNWIRTLNPLDRYLFIYLLTNEHTNISGIYELPVGSMAYESGLDERDLLNSMLPNLEPKVIYFDGWVIIKNFIKQQAVNPKIEKGIASIIQLETPIRIKQKAFESNPSLEFYEEFVLPIARNNTNRNIIKEKDICASCQKEFKKEDLIIHHIVPLFAGGGNERDNLEVLCVDCHKNIHQIIGYDSLSKPTNYYNINSNTNSNYNYNISDKVYSKFIFRGLPCRKDNLTGKWKALDNGEWLEVDERFLKDIKENV